MNQTRIWALPAPGPQLISVGGDIMWNLSLQLNVMHTLFTDQTNMDVMIRLGI